MHKSIGSYAIIYMLLTEARNGGGRCLHGVILYISCDSRGRFGCLLISKWLDRNGSGNKLHRGSLYQLKKKNPPTVRCYGLGIHSAFIWNCHIFLPVGIIAFVKTFFNMLFSIYNLLLFAV